MSHEYSFPDQSSVRRYYVETSSVTRNPWPDQNNLDVQDSLKFYVVARKNYSAVDFPFVVPKLFSQVTNTSSLFRGVEEGGNDFFDRGVNSSDDSDVLEESPISASSVSPSYQVSPERRRRASRVSNDYDTSNFFDEPFDTDVTNEEEEHSHFKSQSPGRRMNVFDQPRSEKSKAGLTRSVGRPQKTPLKIGDRTPVRHKPGIKSKASTPLRLPKGHSRAASEGDLESADHEDATLELEDLKSSRGSQMSRGEKSRRGTGTTNKLYKLDRKTGVSVKKGALKETKEGYKVTKKGPYQILRESRKLGLPKPENKRKLEEKKQDLAIYKGGELAERELDMGGFDEYEGIEDEEKTPPKDLSQRRGALVKRKPRPSVSSSALLNSWYISTRSESEDKNYEYDKGPEMSNTRYPRRFRRPPSQHWMSNLTSDGKSVLFMAGVSTQKLTTQHLTDERFPTSSLVLTNDHGNVELEIVKTDGKDGAAEEDPKQKSLSDYVKTIAPRRYGQSPKRDLEQEVKALSDVPRKARRLKRGTGATAKLVRRSEEPSEPKWRKNHESKGADKEKMVKVTRDMSAEKALELLRKLPEVYDGGKTLSIAIDDDVNDQSESERRVSDTHAKMLKSAYDSFVEHGKERIYYKCVHKPEQNRIPCGALVFNTMVFTSQCRTSDVRIPAEKDIDFKDVQTNFIFGYVHSGKDLAIEGDGVKKEISQGKTFFLPTHKKWKIKNNSK
ncbi:conserved hypothetical protein [Theileria orientalis strain Shintoku]|uniref:Uncharacterized protein n=1 Tax=Theileria orientalis strain Shintoku TaxID=869250 RepID=J4C9C0_THEOR|nr:conserved hypothetical protein [Theileria orientalis strain Shintoku]BAM42273.1 conserved hypothetical protein [Theileria orientalis strain Shintoku]|eukprot:XP_009692574.1 conserved hypothetical protein [Theileria orientalis strain Shintoku]